MAETPEERVGISTNGGEIVQALREMIQQDQLGEAMELDWSSQAEVLCEQGVYEEARQLLERALTASRQRYGNTHPVVATLLYNLATLYKMGGKYGEAERFLVRTNFIRGYALGPEHPDTIRSLCALGDVYSMQGKRKEAETIYQRALTNCEQVLGLGHTFTLKVFDNMEKFYREWAGAVEKGNNEKKIGNGSATDGEKLSGLEAARILHKLALLYVRQDILVQAESVYRSVLSVYEYTPGDAHEDIVQCLHELAFLYKLRGEEDKAEATLRRILAVREEVLGTTHADVAASLNDLAALSKEQGKFEQAEQLLQRALEICADLPATTYPVVVLSLTNLAALYLEQGKRQPAIPLLKRVLLILEQALGPEHPEVAAVQAQYRQLMMPERNILRPGQNKS